MKRTRYRPYSLVPALTGVAQRIERWPANLACKPKGLWFDSQ